MTPDTETTDQDIPGPQQGTWLARRRRLAAFVEDSVGLSMRLFKEFGPMVALTRRHGERLYSPLAECTGIFLTYGSEAFKQAANHHDTYGKFPLTGQLFAKRGTCERTSPLNHFLTGLFGVNGDAHRQHRRLLMPAFHKQRLEVYAQEMGRITESFLRDWKVGMQRDIAADMQLLTMRIATKTLFGEDVGNEGVGTGTLLRDSLRLSAHWLTAALPWDLPGFPYRRFLNGVAVYEREMRGIIQRKRASGHDGNDVLSMLLQAQDADSGARLSEDEVLGHVGVLFAAGHETSANALTWTLFLLSQHPQVTRDLHDELDGNLRGNIPGPEHLDRLPLLERVVQESMRVLPPVPWNARVLLRATELGGFELPAGAELWLSIFQTHRSQDLFSEPGRFRPARWESIHPGPFEYVPFSAGPRMCIGAGFAMLETRLILATLLQRFRFELVEGAAVDRAGIVVLAPRKGMPMRLVQGDYSAKTTVPRVQGNIRELVELPG
jgi:cytochrome P450